MCDMNCKQCKLEKIKHLIDCTTEITCIVSLLFGMVYSLMCTFFLHMLLYNWMYSHGNKSLMVFFWMIAFFTVPLCIIEFAQSFGVVTTK